MPLDAPLLAVSTDGRQLVTLSRQSGPMTLRNAANGEPILTRSRETRSQWALPLFQPGSLWPLIFSSNSRDELQRTDASGLTAVWRSERLAETQGAVDPAATRYAFALGSLDLQTGGVLWRLDGDLPGQGSRVAISADARLMAAGGRHWPQRVRVYDAAGGMLVREILDLSSPVSGLAFTPDGALLAVASQADGIRVWETAGGTLRHSLSYPVEEPILHFRPCIVISPDGRWLAANYQSQIGVFDLASGSLLWEIRTGNAGHEMSMAFSPDGVFLYTAGNRVAAWRLN
jgi:WD40 repeat protein